MVNGVVARTGHRIKHIQMKVIFISLPIQILPIYTNDIQIQYNFLFATSFLPGRDNKLGSEYIHSGIRKHASTQ